MPGGSCAPTLAKPPPKIGDYLNLPEVPEARIHRGDSNHDSTTGVLAASLAKRAAGYTSLGFPDPRHIPHTPSSRATPEITDSLA
jgi:hypothetical protein